MKLKSEHLAVLAAASTDDTRVVLCGLAVYPDHVVATDSYGLVAVQRLPGDQSVTDFETILPASFVTAIKSAAKRDGCVEITNDGNGHVEASLVLAGTELTWQAPRIEGEFPRWQRCIPKGEPIAEVHLNPKLLIRMLTAMVGAGAEEGGGVFLRVYADEKGQGLMPLVLIRSKDPDQECMVAMVMPMEPDKPAKSPWLDKHLPQEPEVASPASPTLPEEGAAGSAVTQEVEP